MNIKRSFAILILLFCLLTVSACAAKQTYAPPQATRPALAAATQAPMATVAPQKEAPHANQAQSGEGANTTAGDATLLNYQSSSVRMVIKDAEINLLVADTDRAIDQVTQLAADYGGYLISSQSWYDGEFKYATIRLAVPSASFETALTNLRHAGVQVLSETGSGQDVSAEYTDLGSRLTNLEATAARVRAFLDAAQTVEESLKVNQQLSELESQIETIKGQMKYYEGRTAYSTITANLTPQRPTPTPSPTPTPTATPTPAPAWNPGNTFQDASGVLTTLFRTTIDLLIWLGVVLGPFLLLFILIVWLLDRLLHLRKRLQAMLPVAANQPVTDRQSVDSSSEKP